MATGLTPAERRGLDRARRNIASGTANQAARDLVARADALAQQSLPSRTPTVPIQQSIGPIRTPDPTLTPQQKADLVAAGVPPSIDPSNLLSGGRSGRRAAQEDVTRQRQQRPDVGIRPGQFGEIDEAAGERVVFKVVDPKNPAAGTRAYVEDAEGNILRDAGPVFSPGQRTAETQQPAGAPLQSPIARAGGAPGFSFTQGRFTEQDYADLQQQRQQDINAINIRKLVPFTNKEGVTVWRNVDDPGETEKQRNALRIQHSQEDIARGEAKRESMRDNPPTPSIETMISGLPEDQQGQASSLYQPIFDYLDQAEASAFQQYGNSARAIEVGDAMLEKYINETSDRLATFAARHDVFNQTILQNQLDASERLRDNENAIVNRNYDRADSLLERQIRDQQVKNERDRKDLMLDLAIGSSSAESSAHVGRVYEALKAGDRILSDLVSDRAFLSREASEKSQEVERNFLTNESNAYDNYRASAMQLEDKMFDRALEIDKTVFNYTKDRNDAITKMENDYLKAFSEIAGKRADAAVENNKFVQTQMLEIAKFEHKKDNDKFNQVIDLERLDISQGNLQVAQSRYSLDVAKWNKTFDKVDLKLSEAMGGLMVNEYGETVLIDGYPGYMPGAGGSYFDDPRLDSLFFSPEDLYSRTAVTFGKWSGTIGTGDIISGSPNHTGVDKYAIDIDGMVNDKITPFVNGYVQEINAPGFANYDPNSPYGNFVTAVDNNRNVHLYAHLDRVNCNEGDELKRGVPFATMGATGNVIDLGGGGSHLHYRVTDIDGNPVQLDKFIPASSDTAIPLSGKSPYVDNLWNQITAQNPGLSAQRKAEEIISRANLESGGNQKFVNAVKQQLVYEYGQGDLSILEPSSESRVAGLTQKRQDEVARSLIDFEERLRMARTSKEAVSIGKEIMKENRDIPVDQIYALYETQGYFFSNKTGMPMLLNLIQSPFLAPLLGKGQQASTDIIRNLRVPRFDPTITLGAQSGLTSLPPNFR